MNQNEAGDNNLLTTETTSDKIKPNDDEPFCAHTTVEFCLRETPNERQTDDNVENPTHDTNTGEQHLLASENTAMKQFPVSNADTTTATTTTTNVAYCGNELQTLQKNNSLSLIATTNATTATVSATISTTESESKSETAAIPSSSTISMPHLNHTSSAPTFASVPFRAANQQQQAKIKIYHDAKQTALWDTTGSTSTGGTILKTPLNNLYCTPRMVRKSSDNSNSGPIPRRVSFPKSDSELVTGYLEPANPWEHVSSVNSTNEIVDLYTKSCHKHNTQPLAEILDHLKAVELNKLIRQPVLSLKNTQLRPGDCEALEEVLKRVQYKCIDLSSCELEESALSALCDIIEYYEAANELNISSNPKGMTNRGWTSCANMVGRSQALQILNAEGNPISKSSAECLGNALRTSNLHTIKLEHCGLKGDPLKGLCLVIHKNRNLKELWLAHNDLDHLDAEYIAELLRINHFLELVDISNNKIGDLGLKLIVQALAVQTKEMEKRSTFQRAAAIESDDMLSPVESETFEETLFSNENSDSETNETTSKQVAEDSSSDAKQSTPTSVLIPCLEDFAIEIETISSVPSSAVDSTITPAIVDENEAEDDTEDTVKPNTNAIIKNKSQFLVGDVVAVSCGSGVGGQSMLDKLLSMNSDSSSEEGASNFSTDTIAACGSEDASFQSDDIFEIASIASATTTANSKTGQFMSSEPISMAFEAPLQQLCEEIIQNNEVQTEKIGREKIISCDTCTLEAKNLCKCGGSKILNVDDAEKTNECQTTNLTTNNDKNCNSNINRNNKINTNNNNNNNISNIVQSEEIGHRHHHQDAYDPERDNKLKEVDHTQQQLQHQHTEKLQINPSAVVDNKITKSSMDSSAFKEMTSADDDNGSCDIPVPCASNTKPSMLMMRPDVVSSLAVDVNKNSRLTEDYEDTHSLDSAFESASEGDISRHLPEEFTRLSTSLESTRLDDITSKELVAIETATIVTESTELLTEEPLMSTTSAATTKHTLAKIGTQKSDEVKTKENVEVRFAEPLHAECIATTNSSSKSVSNTNSCKNFESSLPQVTIGTESMNFGKVCEENSPIPTPPPPATSPGGAGISMRRTDSSCNFMTQSTRNHSHSSDSLCSDNSMDGSVSSDLNLSSASTTNERFTKNDTLTRQQRYTEARPSETSSTRSPAGLKALAVWNNNLTREAGVYISDLLTDTSSLELLNIGKNILSNDFVFRIKDSLTKNTTLTTLGLQSAHLSASGIEALAAILSFGGNSTLQRIDIRDNKLEVESLNTLAEALKSNTTVTQIDINDEPKRIFVGSDAYLQYTLIVENIRSMCSRNEKTQAQLLAEKTANSSGATAAGKRRSGYYVGSRKISLTCPSRPLIECSVAPAVAMTSSANKLEVKRKSGVRLRSPVPSPPTISPSSSPSRSRFQVCRVSESSPLTSPLAQMPPPTAAAISVVNSVSIPMELASSVNYHHHHQQQNLTASHSLPSMATATSSTQTIKRPASSSRSSRFHVSKIYEDPKVPMDKRSLPPITPPIHLPPSPMIKAAPKHQMDIDVTDDDVLKEINNLTNKESNDPNKSNNSTLTASSMAIADVVAQQRVQNVRCPIAVFNENDITLTHDSANEMRLTAAAAAATTNTIQKDKVNPPVNSQPADDENDDDSGHSRSDGEPSIISGTNLMPNPDSQHQGARKLSCPTAVDKLLTLFNRGAIFQRSSSPEPPKNLPTMPSHVTDGISTTQATTLITTSSPNTVVKPTPPNWSILGADILNVTVGETEKNLPADRNETRSFLDVASKQLFDLGKQVFRQSTLQQQQQQTTNVCEFDKKLPLSDCEDDAGDAGFNVEDTTNAALNVSELILPSNDLKRTTPAEATTFDDKHEVSNSFSKSINPKVTGSPSTFTDSSNNF